MRLNITHLNVCKSFITECVLLEYLLDVAPLLSVMTSPHSLDITGPTTYLLVNLISH